MEKNVIQKIRIRIKACLHHHRIRRSYRKKTTEPRRRGCMSRLLRGFLVYLLLCGLLGYWMGSSFGAKETVLEDNSIYMLKMEGNVVEQGNLSDEFSGLFSSFSSDETVGLDDLLSNIRLAREDEHIQGIYLYGAGFSIGQASAKALRDELQTFRQSGKWIIAYADSYSQTNYYICSVADKIYLNPVGSVDWKGISAQKMYYTRLLEKIGVEMQIVKVGTFKSAVEPFFCTEMSEADRKQTERYVQGIWEEMRAAVSVSRGISEATLDSLADQYMGLQDAEANLKAGLVDHICYTEEMDSILKDLMSTEDYHLVKTDEMVNVKREEKECDQKIVVLYAEGDITDNSGDGIVGDKMIKEIKKIRKDDDVKAVVLRVNSPGGSADASEKIWHAIQTLREKGLPVVVSMGDYAASGGYYISCGADYIYAEPNTLTGSIGIFGTVPNFGPLREKIGLDIDGVSTHEHSAMETNMVYKGMNSEEERMMQAMVERGYDLFTRRCAEGRGMTQDSIKMIAEGRVWLGKDALELGLVDSLGNINDAISKAAALAGVEEYAIEYLPGKKDFMTQLLEMLDETDTEEEKLIARIRSFAEKSRIMARMEDIVIE